MTRALAAELGKDNITANVIAPGYFVTDINTAVTSRPGYIEAVDGVTPMDRWGRPEELVGTLIYLASRGIELRYGPGDPYATEGSRRRSPSNSQHKGAVMNDRFSSPGQVAIVTGSSRGLGFEMAKAIAEFGARVYMTARGQDQLEESASTLGAAGSTSGRYAFDLCHPNACVAAIVEIGAAEGRLDILVNNAGINAWEPSSEAKTFDVGPGDGDECSRQLRSMP